MKIRRHNRTPLPYAVTLEDHSDIGIRESVIFARALTPPAEHPHRYGLEQADAEYLSRISMAAAQTPETPSPLRLTKESLRLVGALLQEYIDTTSEDIRHIPRPVPSAFAVHSRIMEMVVIRDHMIPEIARYNITTPPVNNLLQQPRLSFGFNAQ